MSAAIELVDVAVRFGDYEVLSEVSVAFPAGKTTFLIGKAGSGKSTLLKTAAGLIVPDRGRVFRLGKDLARMNRAEDASFRRTSAFAFQDSALWANQTIHNNLALPLAVHEPQLPKAEVERRVKEAALSVGYAESLALRPADLSVGEQKLISLARTFILDPELVFLDEPTSALDEDSVERVSALIGERKKAGKTLVVISQRARVVGAWADCLCVLSNGKVADFGTAGEVARRLGGELLKRVRAAEEADGA